MTTPHAPRLITGIADGARLPPDTLVNLVWLARDSGMSEKWFYKLIARGDFMPPIKFGRHSRWRVGDYYDWLDARRERAFAEQAARRAQYQAQQQKAARRAGEAS
ncbi:helix-turn-helix transcriptional regulator [Enterobacter ludwigii]|uniref:helix-turn-helix transcriptional regulator n=1 Tax=Enterobacter ludwigii TaxID=299767 RepID=UPI0008028599|nr:hypothetical protein [Enterobacter ludwigii]